MRTQPPCGRSQGKLASQTAPLSHYFRNKDDLLEAAYVYVYDQTNQRIIEATRGLTGLTALRRYCFGILPLDESTILEAKIVLAFWPRAASDARLGDITDATISAGMQARPTELLLDKQFVEFECDADRVVVFSPVFDCAYKNGRV